jgi:hypothetical protein
MRPTTPRTSPFFHPSAAPQDESSIGVTPAPTLTPEQQASSDAKAAAQAGYLAGQQQGTRGALMIAGGVVALGGLLWWLAK